MYKMYKMYTLVSATLCGCSKDWSPRMLTGRTRLGATGMTCRKNMLKACSKPLALGCGACTGPSTLSLASCANSSRSRALFWAHMRRITSRTSDTVM